MVFGGVAAGQYLNDEWAWDGSAWHSSQEPTEPPWRAHGAMAFDEQRGKVVLFGGVSEDGSSLNDLWMFDNARWERIQTSPMPSVRHLHGLVYDAWNDCVVLFGGFDEDGPRGNTWELHGKQWVETTPTSSLDARGWHGMFFDRERGVVALVGGDTQATEDPPIQAEVWEYDGESWTEVSNSMMNASWGDGAAYDRHRRRGVLVGGQDLVEENGGALSAWVNECDASWWTSVNVGFESYAPQPRVFASMVFAPHLNGVLLTGGDGDHVMFRDTWLWDGLEWREITPGSTPEPGYGAAACYDSWRGVTVQFGGYGNPEGTWLHAYWSDHPDERCDNGTDDDEDGLTDCADPDCLYHPHCTPREVCDSELDDDGDGAVDCADPSCGGIRCGTAGKVCLAGACDCPTGALERWCDNRKDDDCNFQVDSQNDDCALSPYCLAGGLCQPWEEVGCQEILNDTTKGGSVDTFQYGEDSFNAWTGPKRFYRFTALEDGPVSVLLSGAGLAVTQAVHGPACDPTGHLIGEVLDETQGRVEFTAVAQMSYFIIVDAVDASPGEFELRESCQ